MIQGKLRDNTIFCVNAPAVRASLIERGGDPNIPGGGYAFPNNTGEHVFKELFGEGKEVLVLVPLSKCFLLAGVASIGGYCLARRPVFNGPVYLTEGVEKVCGGFEKAAGSKVNPLLGAFHDTVFRLRVRESFALQHGLSIEASFFDGSLEAKGLLYATDDGSLYKVTFLTSDEAFAKAFCVEHANRHVILTIADGVYVITNGRVVTG